MRAGARGTATVRRHLPDKENRAAENQTETLVGLEELATTLKSALTQIQKLHQQERAAA